MPALLFLALGIHQLWEAVSSVFGCHARSVGPFLLAG
jgi:hypothetical protein